MDETKVVPAGSFCWNQQCPDYGQVGQGNMRKNGKTPKGVQRYQCKTCKKTCGQTNGTMFYRCRHPQPLIVECLAMVGDRNSLAAIHRIKKVKEETVCQWIERAEQQVKQFEEYGVRNCQLSRVQLDALWTYVGHKGEKGGALKRRNEARFGVEPPLTWTVV
jgi:transposase-like protein